MTIVSATQAVQAARIHLDAVSDPATKPDPTGLTLTAYGQALRQWESAVQAAKNQLAAAHAAQLSARIVHGRQMAVRA